MSKNRFGSTPSKALPNLLMRVYSCAGRALSKMSLADKGFHIAIGPACSVEGCPGKRKTAALSKATVSFVQVIQSHHPIKYQGTYLLGRRIDSSKLVQSDWARQLI